MQTKVRRDKVMRALSVLEMAVSEGRPSRARRKLIQQDARIEAMKSQIETLERRLRHATNRPAPTTPETDAATLASDLEAAKNEIARLKALPPVFPPFPLGVETSLITRKMWDQVQENAKAATAEIQRLKKIADDATAEIKHLKKIADDATTAAQHANNRAAAAVALPSRPTHVYELSEKPTSRLSFQRVGIYTSLEAAKNVVRTLVYPSIVNAIQWLDGPDTSIAAGTQGQMFSILRTKLS